MSKDSQSHAQKRKAKLAKRGRRPVIDLTPLAGNTYQRDRWLPDVYETELAVYEAIRLSERCLKNDQVRAAFIHLIRDLGSGKPALLDPAEPEVPFAPGREVEFLVWNIRRHWGALFAEKGPVHVEHLIGILRTLLHSVEAHAWHTGPDQGYVAFLENFIERTL